MAGQELKSQGVVRCVAGASSEPIWSHCQDVFALTNDLWGLSPVPDLLSAGADNTTELPTAVSAS